jgi:hypothetical protein
MFIEVLVVGIGALSALVLLVAAAVGPRNFFNIANHTNSPLIAGAALALAYTLGILIDRAADTALAPLRRRMRALSFSSDADYAAARLVLTTMPALAARAEYARSRIRVCRGWLLNAVVLTVATDLVIWRLNPKERIWLVLLATCVGAALCAGCFLTWRTVVAANYRKLAEQTTTAASNPQGPVS